jgi:3-hydroxyacyl-[acyl-carrier-protein] dehydratase
VCKPGDVLSLSIKPKRLKSPLATFEGQIRVGQEKAAIAEEITLTFAFAEEAAVPAPQASAAPAAATASAPAKAVNA